MIKFFQVVYGHILLTSILLLITKLLFNLDYTSIFIITIFAFIVLQVRPHPTEQNSLFAFSIQPLFQK